MDLFLMYFCFIYDYVCNIMRSDVKTEVKTIAFITLFTKKVYNLPLGVSLVQYKNTILPHDLEVLGLY